MQTLFEVKGMVKENGWQKHVSEFQTPLPVCKYMVSLLPKKIKTILEPTAGNGNIVSTLKNENKYMITDPEDYFLLPKEIRFDAVVMNPPFSAKFTNLKNSPIGIANNGMSVGYYLLHDCMKRSDIVIALMPAFVLSDSDVRSNFLMKWGLKSITSLPRKTFSYTRIQTIVLELNKGYQGTIEFKIFNY